MREGKENIPYPPLLVPFAYPLSNRAMSLAK